LWQFYLINQQFNSSYPDEFIHDTSIIIIIISIIIIIIITTTSCKLKEPRITPENNILMIDNQADEDIIERRIV